VSQVSNDNIHQSSENDTPQNSLKDSNANLKVKTMIEERVRVRSLTCNTSRVKGACWSFGMGIRTNDK
jgi:hypothetical protein